MWETPFLVLEIFRRLLDLAAQRLEHGLNVARAVHNLAKVLVAQAAEGQQHGPHVLHHDDGFREESQESTVEFRHSVVDQTVQLVCEAVEEVAGAVRERAEAEGRRALGRRHAAWARNVRVWNEERVFDRGILFRGSCRDEV